MSYASPNADDLVHHLERLLDILDHCTLTVRDHLACDDARAALRRYFSTKERAAQQQRRA